jgi:hypothetical protein
MAAKHRQPVGTIAEMRASTIMKTDPFGPVTFGWLCAVAFLALPAAPTAQDAASGSGTYVGTIGTEATSVIFTDVYAFRAEDAFDKTKQVTVVVLSDSALDKPLMTAALRKERDRRAIATYLDTFAYVRLDIDQDGKVKALSLQAADFSYNVSNSGKSDVTLNTTKRVEGRFFIDGKNPRGETRKVDLRFATDLADVGPPVRN